MAVGTGVVRSVEVPEKTMVATLGWVSDFGYLVGRREVRDAGQ